MTRDLWAAHTAEHDTAYGMDYGFHIDPDGTLLSEDARPAEPSWDSDWDDDYDRDGEQ